MVARTTVEGLAGAKLGITSQIPATFDAAGYDASSMLFTPVGQIENYGNHGMTAAVTEFTPVDTAVVAKVKGSKNYGNMALTLGHLPADVGQVLALAASESNNHYSIEITYPDTSVHYLDVLVHKFEYVDGAVNDVQKVNMEFAVCRAPVIIAQA